MEDNNKHNNQYSLFRRGADDGMMFGLYMSILMLSLLGSLSLPWLNLLCMAMIAGVPFYVYWRLRKGYADEGGTMQVSALWMQGIVMFFCASLIMALAVYVYLQFNRHGLYIPSDQYDKRDGGKGARVFRNAR